MVHRKNFYKMEDCVNEVEFYQNYSTITEIAMQFGLPVFEVIEFLGKIGFFGEYKDKIDKEILERQIAVLISIKNIDYLNGTPDFSNFTFYLWHKQTIIDLLTANGYQKKSKEFIIFFKVMKEICRILYFADDLKKN